MEKNKKIDERITFKEYGKKTRQIFLKEFYEIGADI
jgi:hypothetical protein